MKLKRKRDRDIEEIMADIASPHKTRGTRAGRRVHASAPGHDWRPNVRPGTDPDQIIFRRSKALAEWAEKVGDAIAPDEKTGKAKIEGVVDVLNGIDNTISGPAITFQVDPSVAARAGFTTEEIALDASAILEGEPAPPPVVVNDRAYTLRVRFPASNRTSLEAMRDTLLVSSTGHTATLGALASVAETPGQTKSAAKICNGMSLLPLDLEGRGLGSGMAAVQKAVADLHIPASIRVEYGGTYESSNTLPRSGRWFSSLPSAVVHCASV